MLDETKFTEGLGMLAVAFNREMTPQLSQVYWAVLGGTLSDEQWERAVRLTLETERFFPPPSVLLDHGRADDVNPIVPASAAQIYSEILAEYERGNQINVQEVGHRFGVAAANAFAVSGGVREFAWCEPRNVPFRRKAFIDTYVLTVMTMGIDTARPVLPGAPERKLLA